MKRIASLLLTLLLAMVPLAAAENCRITFSVSVADETEVQHQTEAFALQVAEMFADVNVPSLTDFLLRVAQETSLTILVQDKASALDVVLAGYPVLDVCAYRIADAMLLTSSLMPGYAASIGYEPAAETLNLQDMLSAAESLQPVLSAWLAGVEGVRTEGVFAGDAYAGGSYCTTYTLQERDISALLSALLTPEVQQCLQPVLAASELDAEAFFAMLTAENDAHAAENQYAYIIRLVDDANGELVGASLTILKDNVQLATASLGLTSDALDLVVGLGLPQENYWFDLRVDITAFKALYCDTIRLREFRAPKDETYAYATASRAPETWLTWSLTAYEASGKDHIDALLVNELTGEQLRLRGSISEEPSTLTVETVDLPLHMSITIEETGDTVLAMHEGLMVFNIDESSSEAYIAAMEELTKRFAAKMMKIIPMDLLMMLQ